ncbi:MAG TPA: hypothetical protein VFG20_00335 [Planctomycetaceae bacterium]|nr:hypothetical protein [Planctomycetaceae bacterium]
MRRRTARPFGQSVSTTRLFSLLLALGVIWALYNRLGDPATWRFVGFTEEPEPVAATVAKTPATLEVQNELVIPGPNDLDDDEVADFKNKLELVTNKVPLRPREMLLYWQLMEWACTQKTRDLEKRSLKDVIFRQIWEEPEKYQGKLIRLRIRAKQTVRYETSLEKDGRPSNPLGLKEVFEVVGPTEDAIPFHYFVVCPEKPDALKLGDNLDSEVVFVGYFLKIMEYKARDGNTRGAPLLIGRMRMVGGPGAATKLPPSNTGWYFTFAILGIVVVAAIYAYSTYRARRRAETQPLPATLPELDFSGSGPGITIGGGADDEPLNLVGPEPEAPASHGRQSALDSPLTTSPTSKLE